MSTGSSMIADSPMQSPRGDQSHPLEWLSATPTDSPVQSPRLAPPLPHGLKLHSGHRISAAIFGSASTTASSRPARWADLADDSDVEDDIAQLSFGAVAMPAVSMTPTQTPQMPRLPPGKFSSAPAPRQTPLAPRLPPGQFSSGITQRQPPLGEFDCVVACESSVDAPEPITSLMICNVPCRYDQAHIASVIDDSGFKGTYDFLHLPAVTARMKSGNIGYGFINFLNPDVATRFTNVFAGSQAFSVGGQSKKVLTVKPARVQGLAANLAQFGCIRESQEA